MVLLEIRNLITHYLSREGTVRAVDGVSLSASSGEVLGIAGESGSGKTSLALSVTRLLPSNARIVNGEILFDGENVVKMSEDRLRRIRWKDISIIFQSSMNALNPLNTIGDQISEPMKIHLNLAGDQVSLRLNKLLEMVGIDESRAKSYPHELSGGMRQRAVIAMSLACNPRLVIADEPVTALDVMVQAQIMELMKKMQRELDLSVILISHNLSVMAEVCNNLAIMYAGKVVEYGKVESVFKGSLHPYTQLLIRAFPSMGDPKGAMESIPGSPPDLRNLPHGCRFYPRCPIAMDICRRSEPDFLEVKSGHYCACFAT